jgi:acyl-[acyl-carrier-protein]-phospholipid O-acyltransferase/long-chain-fatty-acid--[acyl-carrier-protein] ligase
VTDLLHLEFFRSARRHGAALAMADTTGQSLTFSRALIAALALGRVIARHTPGEDRVGIMLPASVGGALANIAVLAADRVPVNLNFTTSRETLDLAAGQADVRTIVTSRRFLEKAALEAMPGMIFLEDLRGEIGAVARLRALVHARLLPFALLRRWYGGDGRSSQSLATIIFSSGSTGTPKGVMLTHGSVLANIRSLERIFDIGPGDVFIGVLPFFHSFGFTGTLWLPLLWGAGVAYHPTPTDAKTIGELAATHRATMLISTPTFCGQYVRRCTPEQFAHLRWAIVGAEKLRAPLAAEFLAKFGTPLLEGYGCTEMAPVIAVNLPDRTGPNGPEIRHRPGSVGRPIPGVDARIVDRETGAELPIGQEGLLLVRGENMMAGYLHAPERTAEVIRDGWYVTGDIARIDGDGFVFITDRVSRFSKIGGEMVPHLPIEDAINQILGEAASAVTAVPDPVKGERIVAFYARADVSPDTLWTRLSGMDGLPRLGLPRRGNLVRIDAIPTLGTGKVDLAAVRRLALEHAASATDDC